MPAKILTVDDDMALAKTIEKVLCDASFTAVIAHTAEDGVHQAFVEKPDLILLDVMIPSMGGWTACQKIREFSNTPIIFLTALGDVQNIVHGLEMGADDYMVKPVDQTELLARIRAHLRRMKTAVSPIHKFEFDDGALIIDIDGRTISVNNETVDLTPREFDLLAVLVSNAGRVVTTSDLIKKAWGLTDSAALDNIKPYIHYLRKKIETDPASPRWILTARGVGYRFAIE